MGEQNPGDLLNFILYRSSGKFEHLLVKILIVSRDEVCE